MPKTPPEVADEERLLTTVRDNLQRLRSKPLRADHGATLVDLRESLSEERLADDIASIVEQMDRTAALMRQQAKTESEGEVDLDNPYFGHMVLEDDFGKRSILIGKKTFLSDRVRIVDWRNAPVSRLFYQYAEGDDYDEVINGRPVSGEVLVRRTMTIADGALRSVTTDEHLWVRRADGGWDDLKDHEALLAGGAGAAVRPDMLGTHGASGRRDKHLPEIASLLDPEQFKLITRPDSGVVVIQGSAGSGKTTVGLHRIAYLNFHDPRQFRPERIIVMVFSKALAAYISRVLPALGVEGVTVDEYPRWARELRRAHFRGIPDAYSDETPALVSRFKTHTALLRMIDELPRTHGRGEVRWLFEELFTNRDWIARGLEKYAPNAFSEEEIDRIHYWCTRQHWLRSEGGGPNEHDIPVIDVEDDTILLRMHQVLRGPLGLKKGQRLVYDHLMIDEAQDLAPIELAVAIATTDARRSVTIAGDVAQKIMEDRDFTSWTDVLTALSLGHVDISPLQVSYRSTRPIMQVARDILGPLAPDEPVVAPRGGVPVAHLRFADMGAAVTWLAPALTDLVGREPTASVALLTANLEQARDWFSVLDRAQIPHLSLVDEQDFAFAPGIEVTDVRSSKGLEFDYVIVLGVDASAFPAQDASRHLLHVAATRAAHQLWLVSTGVPSPLIPSGLPGILGA